MGNFYDQQNGWVLANPSVSKPLSHRQALNLVERVCRAHRLQVPSLVLEPRINPERIAAWYRDGCIRVPGFPVELWVVLHELAHHGADTRARVKDATQHGAGFRRWYLRIVAEEAGERVAERLAVALE